MYFIFKARIKNGFSVSTEHAVFELEVMVHEESGIWTNLSHNFTKGDSL